VSATWTQSSVTGLPVTVETKLLSTIDKENDNTQLTNAQGLYTTTEAAFHSTLEQSTRSVLKPIAQRRSNTNKQFSIMNDFNNALDKYVSY